MPGTLTLVPTPIGNLSDISPRCREALAEADFIAAEDTRVTLKLLNHLGLKKPLVSYYEHNKEFSGKKILERILAGENCAQVSDAGSPAISDPGEDMVRLCDLFCTLRSSGLEPKRLQFVRHTASSPVSLVLIESRRGGRPGLRYEPDFIEFTPDGAETDDYRAAYGRKEPSCPEP